MRHAVFGDPEVILGEGIHQVLFIIQHGGVQDHLIDVALQGVSSIVAADHTTRGLILLGRAVFPVRRGNRITVDIEWRLLFRLRRQTEVCPPPARRPEPGKLQRRKIGITNNHLLQRRIVSGTGMNGELGQPLGRNQLYLQFTPLPVPFGIVRPIPKHVLVA